MRDHLQNNVSSRRHRNVSDQSKTKTEDAVNAMDRTQVQFPSQGRSMPLSFRKADTMILGMTTSTYTLVHVAISLLGICSGFVVLFGLLGAKRLDAWTALFLATTVLTSVTGFGFPFDHLLPSHKVGIISLVVLAVAILARYVFHLVGA